MRKPPRGTVFEKVFARMVPAESFVDIPTVAFEMFNTWEGTGYPAVLSQQQTALQQDVYGILLKEFGSRVIKVRSGDYGAPERYLSNRSEIRMTVSDLLNGISSPDHPYMANQPSSFNLLKALTGSALEHLGGEGLFECPTVWLGSKGAVTPLHKDTTDNFAFHLSGRKTWVMFSPKDADLLDLRNVNDRAGSEFSVSSIDLRQRAALDGLIAEGASPITRQVCAGECLYIPAGWSHFVRTEEVTLMVNVWQAASFPARVLR